jgi:hypothetical protein
VNTSTAGDQSLPAVALEASGNFVVTWTSDGQDGSFYGVFGRRYASSGSPQGPDFRVNTYTFTFQVTPSVAADASGNFVVVWGDDSEDGSGYGIYGQRFGAIVPVELLGLGVE